MDFEWDRAKSERNESERGLPLELAFLLFDGPTIECVDKRRYYGETRIRANRCRREFDAALRLYPTWRGTQDHQPALCEQEGTGCLSCDVPGLRSTRPSCWPNWPGGLSPAKMRSRRRRSRTGMPGRRGVGGPRAGISAAVAGPGSCPPGEARADAGA